MHRRRTMISLAGVLALLGTILVASGAPAGASGPSDLGEFQPAFSEGHAFDAAPPSSVAESIQYPTAVSAVGLPNGQVVYWNGLENLESDPYPIAADASRISPGSRSRLLSFGEAGPSWQTPSPEDGGWYDLFCADQRTLLDGSVMAAGGTIWKSDPVDLNDDPNDPSMPGGTAELFGNPATRIYRAGEAGGTWIQAGSPQLDSNGHVAGYSGYMHNGRWYPAIVTLPDGRLFVAGGVARLIYNAEGHNVYPTEIFNPWNAAGAYDPAHGAWTQNAPGGDVSLPLFARLHLVPGLAADGSDAKVLYDGDGQMWGPFGQSYDEALWNIRKSYDPATNTWTDAGIGHAGALNGAASIMLPFTSANGYMTARILHAGGTLGTSPGGFVATAESELLTVTNGQIETETLPDLPSARWYSSSVIGPTGEVLVFNGADKDEVVAPGTEKAVREVDMFDPVSKTWKALASSNRERTYHNSAILLGDGTVLVGGHSPINTLYGPGNSATGNSNYLHDNGAGTANNLKDPSFEIFKPPYLFRGARPTITSNVSGTFTWGDQVNVATDSAQDPAVTGAMLVRLPATTHTTDADMRAVQLDIAKRVPGNLQFTLPQNRAALTPGYYRLFLLQDNGQGPTPSTNSLTIRVVPAGFTTAGFDMKPASLPKASIAGPAHKVASPLWPAAPAAIVAEPSGVSGRASRAPASSRRPGLQAVAIAAAALVTMAGAMRRRRRLVQRA